jgi:hypothetical protein
MAKQKIKVSDRAQVYNLEPIMTVEESDKWQGRMLKAEDCRLLIKEDADVYDKETGKVIAKFRKRVIPASIQIQAYSNLLEAATPTDSRGVAGGRDEEDGKSSTMRLKKDGTYSKQSIAKNFVESGVAGYYDRSTRFPNCRLTAFNRHHFDKFKAAYPIVKLVDTLYAKLMPVEYGIQRNFADSTSPDFVIPDTAFTTITVNKNYTTAVHKDAGDLKEGFGNLVALRDGTFEGNYFVVVRWGVGFDLQNGDLLLVDVHQWHANTPMIKHEKKATRLSLVMYYREKMIKCGTMKQELQRVKKRKKGDPL